MDMVEDMLKGAEEPAWLERPVSGDLRMWQIIFMGFAGFVGIMVALCCCIRFRIPRTKQQIEADYQRRIITKRFRHRLEKIENAQMDTLDLKAAVELVRADMKLDDDDDHYDEGCKGEQRPSVSIISSVLSQDRSLVGDSPKLSLDKDDLKPLRPTVTFGSRLVALIRMSKPIQERNPQENP